MSYRSLGRLFGVITSFWNRMLVRDLSVLFKILTAAIVLRVACQDAIRFQEVRPGLNSCCLELKAQI